MNKESFQIGWFILDEDTKFTNNSYECAAWYETILVPAGKYPVIAGKFYYHERDKHYTNKIDDNAVYCKLEGIVTSSDFTSQFGGVPFGSGQIDKNKGKKSNHLLHPYAHALAKSLLVGEIKEWELLTEYEAREITFVYDGEEKKTYGIFKKESVNIS